MTAQLFGVLGREMHKGPKMNIPTSESLPISMAAGPCDTSGQHDRLAQWILLAARVFPVDTPNV